MRPSTPNRAAATARLRALDLAVTVFGLLLSVAGFCRAEVTWLLAA